LPSLWAQGKEDTRRTETVSIGRALQGRKNIMFHPPNPRLCILCICQALLLAVSAGTARATLGEPISSLEANRVALKSVRKSSTAHGTYTVHEDVSDGATIRQYVSSSGVVFAVAWDGVSHPDLAALLGTYTEEYRQVQRTTSRKPGTRRAQLRGSRVVVERWGHMRNLHGRAYATDIFPGEVSLDEIR
jgi:hypothetical protein